MIHCSSIDSILARGDLLESITNRTDNLDDTTALFKQEVFFVLLEQIFVGEGIQETIVLPEVEIDPLHHSPCDCMLSAAPVHA